MIQIKQKQDCCGCSACLQICPKQCIFMHTDDEGFRYPEVDTDLCIDCHLCEKVCPVIHQDAPRQPLQVFAAKNPDEKIRIQSSSGGIFMMLAEQIIAEGGVVFGAKFDADWNVVHDYTETCEGLVAFRGSKYLQSQIGESFRQAECFLKKGRWVLFSGTPCQIAGLKKYLRKGYDKLLAVEVFCHGAPSPMVWHQYLREFTEKKNIPFNKMQQICFRDKSTGWKNYSFTISDEQMHYTHLSSKDDFMRGFLADLYLRPSCYACPAKALKSGSDITLGDFWGIQNVMPDYDDDKGVSAVLLNTEKGVLAFNSIAADTRKSNFETVALYNPALVHNPICSKKRAEFYKKYKTDLSGIIRKLSRPPFKVLVAGKIKNAIRKVLCKKINICQL